MTFEEGGGRRKNRRVWKWEEEEIEEAKKLKYLGSTEEWKGGKLHFA